MYSVPHRRFNPLRDEWVLVSPNRTQRPWQGQQEAPSQSGIPSYDSSCYLCPGNTRSNGEKNPNYTSTFVFPNDFPALLPSSLPSSENQNKILQYKNVLGECRVVCFSPKHNETLSSMSPPQIKEVIHTWISQTGELEEKYKWIQIFENKGSIMGCSNPHPHGQIWASNFVPNEVNKEDIQQRKYYKKNRSVLLLDYLNEELKVRQRIIVENKSWIVLVPFWAVWPFETIVLPKKFCPYFSSLSEDDVEDLSRILKQLLTAYDRLFSVLMPYSMGWHFALANSKSLHWQLHAHYYPPLLRSATVKKFMVGYEMLGEPQRDITPEQAAQKLSELIKNES